jgi:Holliday junction resolvasome RuvABC ATP-dependent DNA helicase subunit
MAKKASSGPRNAIHRVGRNREIAAATTMEAAISRAIGLALLEVIRRGDDIVCDGQHRINHRILDSLINSAEDSEIEVIVDNIV